MFLNFILFFSLCFTFVSKYAHGTMLGGSLVRCRKNTHLLNGCNWCRCGEQSTFVCTSRPCREVDMFEHFKENVQELHVGMEGHGTWRSSLEKSCEPMMQYSKGNVSCICSEAGTWPKDVCEKLFQVLFEVHITGVAHATPKMYCNHTELYLIGCNACFCPKSGFIDPELCTKQNCTDDDPALAANRGQVEGRRFFTIPFKSLYANCVTNKEYKIGCRQCTCKENNTLVCGDCKNDVKLKQSRHICYGNRKYTFIDDCNICYCGEESFAMCTTKRCYNASEAGTLEGSTGLPGAVIKLEFDKTPDHDKDCIPGTKFLKHCSVCNCMVFKGVKIIDCQVDTCSNQSKLQDVMSSYCIPGTSYELDCLYCRCFKYRGIIWQRCVVNKSCTISDDVASTTTEVPLTYSANNDVSEESSDSDDISLDVIRMFDDDNVKCIPDTTYKLDCNYCICLSNGNSMCTFFTCK